MAVIYKVVKEFRTKDRLPRISYGIAALSDNGQGRIDIIKYIGDICDREEKIENLVRLCNQSDLSPVHLYDVVEDFIS
ncbi:MAG: hypothetical protein IJO74_00415 [Clostridia bacterium]|nr:hypothetical protein [Clostridia bacterium]